MPSQSRRSPTTSTTPDAARSTPSSPWRLVRARVHLSLTPQELPDAAAHASNRAYQTLLLRHNPSLGGVVVAHTSPLKLQGAPRLIDASPFAHVSATTTLLVFAPPPGTLLTGVVSYVGPDHIGLSVHAVFHAVLPIDGVSDRFRYDGSIEGGAVVRRWLRIHSDDVEMTDAADIVVGRSIRFSVSSVKATRSGLFQMFASLDGPQDARLGVLDDTEEAAWRVAARTVDEQPIDDVFVEINLDTKSRRRRGKSLALSAAFGDGLAAPSVDELKDRRKKKRRRSEIDDVHTANEMDASTIPESMERKKKRRKNKSGKHDMLDSPAVSVPAAPSDVPAVSVDDAFVEQTQLRSPPAQASLKRETMEEPVTSGREDESAHLSRLNDTHAPVRRSRSKEEAIASGAEDLVSSGERRKKRKNKDEPVVEGEDANGKKKRKEKGKKKKMRISDVALDRRRSFAGGISLSEAISQGMNASSKRKSS